MRGFKRSDGFTLVELMVVVLIIGILVAVAVPVFKTAKASAEANTCKANQRMMYGAIQVASAEGVVFSSPQGYIGYSPLLQYRSSLHVELVPRYLKAVPVCPSATQPVASGVQHNSYYYDAVGAYVAKGTFYLDWVSWNDQTGSFGSPMTGFRVGHSLY